VRLAPQFAQLASKFESKIQASACVLPPCPAIAKTISGKNEFRSTMPRGKSRYQHRERRQRKRSMLSQKRDRTMPEQRPAVSLPQLPWTPCTRPRPVRSPGEKSSPFGPRHFCIGMSDTGDRVASRCRQSRFSQAAPPAVPHSHWLGPHLPFRVSNAGIGFKPMEIFSSSRRPVTRRKTWLALKKSFPLGEVTSAERRKSVRGR